MRIAIFTETFIHKNTAAANQAAVLQKGLQQLGHKVFNCNRVYKSNRNYIGQGYAMLPC